MTGTIKINGKYGAHVGNLPVFTYEGAVRAYKIFVQLFDKDVCMETSVAMGNAAKDLHNLGFSWEEIEEIEISTYGKEI
jgi:hypothetical protein